MRVRSTNTSETVDLPVADERGLDVGADRLADPRELARRDAGEHPVHHRPRQRVTIGEVLIGRDRQLAARRRRVRIRGRLTGTRRPPNVIDPSSWP